MLSLYSHDHRYVKSRQCIVFDDRKYKLTLLINQSENYIGDLSSI